jgi:hypothetical protein
MKRKLLMEENDEQQSNGPTRFDAFGQGVEVGVHIWLRVFGIFILFFIVSILYMIFTF